MMALGADKPSAKTQLCAVVLRIDGGQLGHERGNGSRERLALVKKGLAVGQNIEVDPLAGQHPIVHVAAVLEAEPSNGKNLFTLLVTGRANSHGTSDRSHDLLLPSRNPPRRREGVGFFEPNTPD